MYCVTDRLTTQLVMHDFHLFTSDYASLISLHRNARKGLARERDRQRGTKKEIGGGKGRGNRNDATFWLLVKLYDYIELFPKFRKKKLLVSFH